MCIRVPRFGIKVTAKPSSREPGCIPNYPLVPNYPLLRYLQLKNVLLWVWSMVMELWQPLKGLVYRVTSGEPQFPLHINQTTYTTGDEYSHTLHHFLPTLSLPPLPPLPLHTLPICHSHPTQLANSVQRWILSWNCVFIKLLSWISC